MSVVNDSVVWVSGHRATWARTLDGGATWTAGTLEPDSLQFRDVHALSADTAYLLAAGPGEMSRIYRTNDGGHTWALQFVATDPRAFYDCLDFWDVNHGLVFGDAVDGHLAILTTADGGNHWTALPDSGMPPPQAAGSEGGFAASGTCLVTWDRREAWIGTGAGDTARVLRTLDRGRTWMAAPVPVLSGTGSSGITTLIRFNRQHGLALGGDLGGSDRPATGSGARTDDGGRSWTPVAAPAFSGAIYGAAAVRSGGWAVAVGPGGMAFTSNGGASWQTLDTTAYWAVGFSARDTGWSVGPDGRITRIVFTPAPG